jgi:hypothetical protein
MSDKLTELTALAQRLVEADAAVVEAERELKDAKERARLIREEDIPGLMTELGVDKVRLENGAELTVKEDVHFMMTNEQKPVAYQWLEQAGHGGLIKTEVKVAFGKGELKAAQSLITELATQFNLEADLKRDVHWQTLAAFLREQVREARPFPMELFGANPVRVAQVKLPKPKKGAA